MVVRAEALKAITKDLYTERLAYYEEKYRRKKRDNSIK